MDAIRGLYPPGYSNSEFGYPGNETGYYPMEEWTVVEKADPGLVEEANDKSPMVEILTDVTEGDPRFGKYPANWPEEEPEPGPPPPTYEELENQVGQLTSENAQLQADLDTANGENATLSQENADLTGQVTNLTAQVDSLNGQLEQSRQDLADCQAQLPPSDEGGKSSRKKGE